MNHLRKPRQGLRRILGHNICRLLHSVKTSGPFKVLFLGRDEFSCLVFDQLHRSPDVWQELHVATHPDQKIGRRHSQLSIAPLKVQSQALGLPTHFIPPKVAFRSWEPPPPFNSSREDPQTLLVTASFGLLIPNQLLHIFPPSRRLNVHPSLLPLYRGPAPIQRAIADGQVETGVCVMEMKEKAFGSDVGDIWARQRIPIAAGSSFSQLRDRLAVEGGALLVSVLRQMLSGTAVSIPQDDTKATRAPSITIETAMVDFEKWDAAKLERMHRAISHQRPLTAMLPSSKILQLHSPFPCLMHSALAEPGDAMYDPRSQSLIIRCASGTAIGVPLVKQEGRNLLPVREWWKGVPSEWHHAHVIKLRTQKGV